LTWYQKWFGEEYLDLYSYRDDDEAKQQIAFFRAQVGAVRGPLLDLACGAGRHTAEFRRQGYSAIGCDLSYVLLRTSEAENGPLPLVRGDMRTLPFCDSTFAGLVNFFTSFGYFETEDENTGALREMCRVLQKGSPVLFDYLNIHRELDRMVLREERMMDDQKVHIERWFDVATRTFNKQISIGPKQFLERVKGYDLDEISTLFAASGIGIREVFGDFDGSPYTHASPRLIVIGMKRR
jgi:SAM-dependent methyltransferase